MTTDYNPWQVESIQAFLFLKCPECPFDTKTKDTFQNHAIENHPLSFVLFGKTLKDIKEEKFDSNLITDDYGNQGDVLIKQEKFESNTLNENDLSVSEQFPGQSFEPIERDGKKVYVCSICDYGTNKPSTLKVHILHKHENVRAFNCTECEKSFKAKHHLKRHFASVHQDKDWLIKEEFNKSNYGKTEEFDPDYDPDYNPDDDYDYQDNIAEICEPYLEEMEDDYIDYSASNEYTEDVKPQVPKVQKQVLLQYKSGEVKPKPRIHKCPSATCDKMFSKPSYAKHHHDTVR